MNLKQVASDEAPDLYGQLEYAPLRIDGVGCVGTRLFCAGCGFF